MQAKLSFIFLAIFFSITIISCSNKQEVSKEATPEELSQMNRDFAKALNDKDPVAAADCYMEDAILLPPGEAPVSGRANIKEYWSRVIFSGVFDVAVASTSTVSNGDIGYETGRFQMSSNDSAGNVTTERGKYIELLKRDKDGRWRSTHGIWNSDTLALQ